MYCISLVSFGVIVCFALLQYIFPLESLETIEAEQKKRTQSTSNAGDFEHMDDI